MCDLQYSFVCEKKSNFFGLKYGCEACGFDECEIEVYFSVRD